ncbi:sensor histidine kinase [Actinomadura sp. HBU206391]|uniref:sensor histidine kinase n=1 Tax=Actinomadura sp. HBU206391 TaxID=2731692 RepID=UPI002905DE2B|nr:histidine kinase [Actinomadura sp. HBU206391]
MRLPTVTSPRNLVFDVVVTFLAVVLSLAALTGARATLRPYGGVTAAVLVAAALSLLWRRRAPLAVAWITAGIATVLPLAELVAPGSLVRDGDAYRLAPLLLWPPAGAFAAYGAMAFTEAHRRRWRSWIPVTVLMANGLLVGQVLPVVDAGVDAPEGADTPFAVAFRSVVFVAGGALIGMYSVARRRVLRGLVERAERAERERHLLAEWARADERARLAAEMHDVVTHRVTLMVVQAGALRVSARDEEARSAAEDLRITGCRALEELRDVVGLLRRAEDSDGDPAEAAAEGTPIPDLQPLINESEAVGVPVELVEEGDPVLVAPVVARTAYRIVQEALTNVHKHAPGARVRVLVRRSADELRVTVRNTAPVRAVDADLTSAGSGTGLLGLRQRVELVRGRLETGPDDEGGFRVDAILPTYIPASGTVEPVT